MGGLVTGFFGLLLPTLLTLLTLGVLGFVALVVDGLIFESLLVGAWPCLLTEYGPAVAGLASSGRDAGLRTGRIGATDNPP